jgi:Arc/MetJ-type ribon-helix-helix transcriptional regulator
LAEVSKRAVIKAILSAILDARPIGGYITTSTSILVEVIRMHAATQLIAPARRRRALSDDPLKKCTLKMSGSVIDSVKNLVETGDAASISAFVEDAVRDKLRERRRAKLFAEYEEAARDPAYNADIEADMKAFDVTLLDGLR